MVRHAVVMVKVRVSAVRQEQQTASFGKSLKTSAIADTDVIIEDQRRHFLTHAEGIILASGISHNIR
jgi:uncharacterized protein YbcV (DUF1398 family)